MTVDRDSAVSLPPVHVVTDDEVLARADVADVAVSLLDAGGASLALHLRGPRASGRRLETLAGRLSRARRESGAWLVVNDRIDVAAAAEADGVQLGARSLAPEAARRVAPGLRIGVSVHDVGEARRVSGADWLVGGTIWPTLTHPDRPGGGPDHLAALVAAATAPVVAIGGVTPGRVAAARDAGAAGVAVLRGVWDARDPLRALDEYLSAWSRT